MTRVENHGRLGDGLASDPRATALVTRQKPPAPHEPTPPGSLDTIADAAGANDHNRARCPTMGAQGSDIGISRHPQRPNRGGRRQKQLSLMGIVGARKADAKMRIREVVPLKGYGPGQVFQCRKNFLPGLGPAHGQTGGAANRESQTLAVCIKQGHPGVAGTTVDTAVKARIHRRSLFIKVRQAFYTRPGRVVSLDCGAVSCAMEIW